jgi:hypothetical protein
MGGLAVCARALRAWLAKLQKNVSRGLGEVQTRVGKVAANAGDCAIPQSAAILLKSETKFLSFAS